MEQYMQDSNETWFSEHQDVGFAVCILLLIWLHHLSLCRTDGDTGYDIVFDGMIGDEGAWLDGPIVYSGSAFTFAFWVRSVKGTGTSQTTVFTLR